MKPVFKLLWIKEGGFPGNGVDSNQVLIDLLNSGWMIAYSMPTESAICVIVSKMTDLLDDLSMAVAKAAVPEGKGGAPESNKNTKKI